MKVIRNNNKIFLPDWHNFKHFTKHSKTDVYYLNICNEVFDALQNSVNKEIFKKLSLNEIKELCCFLTSYFEDIISQTNIWKAFNTKHYELYNTFVTFQNTEEYFEEEINLDDIHFLIWYFVSIKNENSLISPYNAYIIDIVGDIYDVFDKNYDYAPENETLKETYFLNPNETDYYIVRDFIEKVFLCNYLIVADISKRLNNQIEAASLNPKDRHYNQVIYALKDEFLLETKSKLLALGANEWAALVLGKEHNLNKDLLNISKKIFGKFLFKNKIDSKYIYIEHIASSKKFNLLKTSYDGYKDLADDDILTMGIIKWQNEWWFSGISMISPFDANVILDEKDSIESRHAVSFLEDQKSVKENLRKQSDAFLSYNNNSPVAFLKKEEISDFTTNFFDYYNNTLNLNKKVRQKAEERVKKKGYLSTNNDAKLDFENDFEMAIIYFNPKSGIEIYFQICSVLDVKSNPYFDKKDFLNENLGLLINDFYSTEFVNYCYDINKDKVNYLQMFSANELDVLLRFFKNNNYKTIPRQTQI